LMRASKLESIGVLAGGIAHDFNNILTAIIGNLALAKMALGPENKVIPRLVESEKVVLRAQSLSQQLLAFSKGGKPVKQVMSVGKLLKESVVFALQGSNVHSEFSIPDDLWPIEADQGQITQVVHNIVLNAQQAMPTGGNIQIKAANFVVGSGAGLHLAAGDYVKIRFNDQGTGISQENLAKIFDPFFTTKPKGSGLGLASAYWIIQRHHGYIPIDSKLGAGTTVSVYLPRSERETPAEEPAEEALITGQGRILFMDDEEAIREFASEVLSQLGYEVECAQNGLEAIELFRKARESRRHFAAAILDLTVRSGMGGKETGRRLREMDPGVKTIVSSGYSNDAVLADFREHGFSARMTKPYTAENLSRILAEVIKI
ncbi:MAG TPA: ATP-binding protein, partial [Nitrospiria bacterium]|nr:ATP-binding protein [Nitrospiria bacterium]